jgi:hypothetical protein
MENRITSYEDERRQDPRSIGEILEELFIQYEKQFPGVRIAVVETPVNAL